MPYRKNKAQKRRNRTRAKRTSPRNKHIPQTFNTGIPKKRTIDERERRKNEQTYKPRFLTTYIFGCFIITYEIIRTLFRDPICGKGG